MACDSRQLKTILRRQAFARREALDSQYRSAASLAVLEKGGREITFEVGTIIAGFCPIRSEIDPQPLLSAWRDRGARICFPVVLDHETILFREHFVDAPLVDTGFGTVGPGPDAPLVDPDLILVPLAAFDMRGQRIGYGAGHYDRALARLAVKGRYPMLIGCAFDCQEVTEIPNEPHDVPLLYILTESGLRHVSMD